MLDRKLPATERPGHLTAAWRFTIALRPNNCWVGMLPTTLAGLTGWLNTNDHHKAILQNSLTAAGDNSHRRQAVQEEYDAWIQLKAGGILRQVTLGCCHAGSDSPIQPDSRFKRTATGNLFIGAASLLRAIKEAAWWLTDSPWEARRLNGNLWVDPGKLVIFRPTAGPLKVADGRLESHVPPQTVMTAAGPRQKASSINFCERVDCPAELHGYLWTRPELAKSQLNLWLTVAGENGLQGFRQAGYGQFYHQIRPASEHDLAWLAKRDRDRGLAA